MKPAIAVTDFVGLFQPLEGLFFSVQAELDHGNAQKRDVAHRTPNPTHAGQAHRSLADAIPAATVENEKAELETLNMKHYPMLKGLSPAFTK